MSEANMRPIPIDDILKRPRVSVDLYIKLSAQKFILVAKTGTRTDSDQLQKYKSRNVHYLHVKAEDYASLVKQTITIAGVAIGRKEFTTGQKMTVLDEALGVVCKEIDNAGFNEQICHNAKLVNEAALALVSSHMNLSSLVESLQQLSNEEVRHSLMVSMVCAMLGAGHDWTKPSTLEKLALGGLLHDIGKHKIPKEILEKPTSRLTKIERTLLESHCETGKMMLMQSKAIPDDVLLMVYEHHELADGSGYPRQLKDFQISPLARVASLANAFADLVLKTPENPVPRTAAKALELIETQMPHLFNRDALKAFRRILAMEQAKVAG